MQANVKEMLKRVATAAVPFLMERRRALKHRQWLKQEYGPIHNLIRPYLFDHSEPYVLSGPFKGVRYLDEIVWSSIVPKWLGSYECELHPVLQEIRNSRYSSVIDIGCAEGYYAIGLAKVLDSAIVYAFDIDPVSRKQLDRLARLNQLEKRVRVGQLCTPAKLSALCANQLIVCDIEGAELSLLNPATSPNLALADILVELHDEDPRDPRIEQTIRERFKSSHQITSLKSVERGAWIEDHKDILSELTQDLRLLAANEHRLIPQVWLWMKALNRASLKQKERNGLQDG